MAFFAAKVGENQDSASFMDLSTRAPSPEPQYHCYRTETMELLNAKDIITINVSGLRFQISLRTLNAFPDTLLGSPARRQAFFLPETNEYFFERHRPCFDAILYFYHSGGHICKPAGVNVTLFLRECKFFAILPKQQQQHGENNGVAGGSSYEDGPSSSLLLDDPTSIPKGKLRRQIYLLLEHPESSTMARLIGIVSLLVILLSTASFCLETIPELQQSYKCSWPISVESTTEPAQNSSKIKTPANQSNATTATTDEYLTAAPSAEALRRRSSELNNQDGSGGCNSWSDPFIVVETLCIFYFTMELVTRFLVCGSKRAFARSLMNWVDLIAIAPFYINFIVRPDRRDGDGDSTASFAILRVLRLARVCRVFKLTRHCRGLQILGKTLTASSRELLLLTFFLLMTLVVSGSVIYFVENGVNDKFTSIPEAFWFSIITLTTVGYGDITPITPVGKLVGAVCAIIGVLVLALPVTVIVSNFKRFYEQEVTRLTTIKHGINNNNNNANNCTADIDQFETGFIAGFSEVQATIKPVITTETETVLVEDRNNNNYNNSNNAV